MGFRRAGGGGKRCTVTRTTKAGPVQPTLSREWNVWWTAERGTGRQCAWPRMRVSRSMDGRPRGVWPSNGSGTFRIPLCSLGWDDLYTACEGVRATGRAYITTGNHFNMSTNLEIRHQKSCTQFTLRNNELIQDVCSAFSTAIQRRGAAPSSSTAYAATPVPYESGQVK